MRTPKTLDFINCCPKHDQIYHNNNHIEKKLWGNYASKKKKFEKVEWGGDTFVEL